MLFLPERAGRRRALGTAPFGALAVVVAVALAGCGKADLRRGQPDARSTAIHARARRAAGKVPRFPAPAEEVALPLPLTNARADAFARAVSLTVADLPGASPTRRSRTPRSQAQEAANCGPQGAHALGGARSADFQRGRGLDRESISSGVEVLTDAGAVRSDLAYASSHAGLACYAKVLGKSLQHEASGNVRVLGVNIARLGLDVGLQGRASGIRVSARVGVRGARVQVQLFVDALSLQYGPAELDLYSTSFVQPVPERTQRELLSLLNERARLHIL